MKKFIFLFLTVFNILFSFSQQKKNGVSFFDANANLTFKLNENFDSIDRDTLKRKFFELNSNVGS